MKIALAQLIHVQGGSASVEQMIYVCHGTPIAAMVLEFARGVQLGNALIHNHCS